MLSSMTAFATFESAELSWQLRSVNHRFLELGFHLPDALRGIEPVLRHMTRGVLRRGKVDATLRLAQAETLPSLNIDRDKLRHLLAAIEQLRRDAPEIGHPDPLDLLRWPGVAGNRTASAAALAEAAQTGFEAALKRLVDSRLEEGGRLEGILEAMLDQTQAIVAELAALTATLAPTLRDRLLERVATLTNRANPERLEQEVAFLAQRADAKEELDRLALHCQSCRDCLTASGPQGRRLDFLMQELQREANTLAAKAASDDAARRAVDLKVVVEQMREQVQNIE